MIPLPRQHRVYITSSPQGLEIDFQIAAEPAPGNLRSTVQLISWAIRACIVVRIQRESCEAVIWTCYTRRFKIFVMLCASCARPPDLPLQPSLRSPWESAQPRPSLRL